MSEYIRVHILAFSVMCLLSSIHTVALCCALTSSLYCGLPSVTVNVLWMVTTLLLVLLHCVCGVMGNYINKHTE